MIANRGLGGNTKSEGSIGAVLCVAEGNAGSGKLVDLGTITSPFASPRLNWLWKQAAHLRICKQLGRMDRYDPLGAMGFDERGAVVLTTVGKNWRNDKCRDAGSGAGLVATSAETPRFVAWGTGAGTAAIADTTLFTEATEARVTAVLTTITGTVTGDTFQAVGQITADGTKNITNAGLFTASIGADLFIHGDHASVPVVLSDAIEYTFQDKLS